MPTNHQATHRASPPLKHMYPWSENPPTKLQRGHLHNTTEFHNFTCILKFCGIHKMAQRNTFPSPKPLSSLPSLPWSLSHHYMSCRLLDMSLGLSVGLRSVCNACTASNVETLQDSIVDWINKLSSLVWVYFLVGAVSTKQLEQCIVACAAAATVSAEPDPYRQMIEMAHNSIQGHGGVFRTIRVLDQWDLKWPTREADVREYIQSCS